MVIQERSRSNLAMIMSYIKDTVLLVNSKTDFWAPGDEKPPLLLIRQITFAFIGAAGV